MQMSAHTFKNVLVVGASGDVGKVILPALIADSNFQVSVLSRAESSATFPSNVNVIKADYSNKDALVKALTGQDVVISTVGGEALLKNFDRTLIEAAVEAGVKWFIPSEYGFDLDHPDAASIPVNNPQLENIKLLKQHQPQLAHTFISAGAFLDWGLDTTFMNFDIANRKAILYDEGKNPVSGIALNNLGKAIVAILKHPQLTLNKRIYLVDATFTQKEMLALLEKHTATKWTVAHVTTEETFKKAEDDWAKGNIMDAFIGFLVGLTYDNRGVCEFEDKAHNAALGLGRVSLDQIVKEAVQRKQTTAQ